MLLTTCITITLLANIAGQSTNDNKIIGNWYLLNPNLIETNDTLLFERELMGNIFSIWHFSENKALTISTGSLRGNSSQAKCFSGVLHYKWLITGSNKQALRLEISMGEKTDLYDLFYLDTENLKLVKIE